MPRTLWIDDVRSISWLLCFSLLAFGSQQSGASQNDRQFVQIGTAEGLSNTQVEAIAMDSVGYMWFATEAGLNRYDGNSMKVFLRGQGGNTELGSNRISSLLVDSFDVLWVGTRGGGLSRYDSATETFQTFRNDPTDPTSLNQDDIMDLAQGPEGSLWVATSRGGLCRLDSVDEATGKAVFKRFIHDPSDTMSLSDDRARDLFFDDDGTLWVGTMGGINRRNPATPDQFLHYRFDPENPQSLPDDEVWTVLRDSDGVLWAGSWAGFLMRLSDAEAPPDEAQFESFPPDLASPNSLQGPRIMTLHEDREGTLWIGTGVGLHEVPAAERVSAVPRAIHHTHDQSHPGSLSGSGIDAIFEDPIGDLWFGTHSGVSRLDRRFEELTLLRAGTDTPLDLSGYPSDALFDRDGTLWVSTTEGLDRIQLPAHRFEEPTRTTFAQKPNGSETFPDDFARAVLETRDGSLWIATNEGLAGLTSTERQSPTPTFDHYHYEEGLSSNAVLTLFEDSDQALWVGTYRGLHRATRDAQGRIQGFEDFLHDPEDPSSLSSRSVSALEEGDTNNLWVGTYFGLNRLNPDQETFTRFLPDNSDPQSLSHEYVASLAFSPPATLWVGTWGGGLNRLDTRAATVEVIGGAEGLPAESVHELLASPDGKLWVGTTNGLLLYDPESKELTSLDPAIDLATSNLSLLRSSNNLLLASSDSGLNILPLSGIPQPTTPPRVVLTELRLLNKPVTPGQSTILESAIGVTPGITLLHSDFLLGLEFSALSYRQSTQIEYRYRLNGLESGWISAEADDRKAVFSTLPPGTYTFEVQARYPNGLWPENSTELSITVLPPWWMTWWARGSLLVTLLATAILWPVGRLRRARHQKELLQQHVAERTLELEEANHKLAEAARIDYLTRLPNRRHFIERANQELTAMKRSGRPFSIAISDIDDFKTINDTWGHDCGDAVLVQVSQLLREGLRETDLVARWGGEEFIFLFYDTEPQGIQTLLEQMRHRVEAHIFKWGPNQGPSSLSVTVTVGITLAEADRPLEDTIAIADAALYAGKGQGKNQVVTAQ